MLKTEGRSTKDNKAKIKQKGFFIKNKLEKNLFRKSLLSSADKHGFAKGQEESLLACMQFEHACPKHA
jgi:hypothetical protein